MMKRPALKLLVRRGFIFVATLLAFGPLSRAQTNSSATIDTNLPPWITHPMSLADALNIALQQNGTILAAKSDLEASEGIVIQTRAIAIPKINANGRFTKNQPSLIETFPSVTNGLPNNNWNTGIQITQSIYEGGRVM